MSTCYGCESPGEYRGVERWTMNGTREEVPTCAEHSRCPTCNHPLEVNPISGRITCFSHGLPHPNLEP